MPFTNHEVLCNIIHFPLRIFPCSLFMKPGKLTLNDNTREVVVE